MAANRVMNNYTIKVSFCSIIVCNHNGVLRIVRTFPECGKV